MIFSSLQTHANSVIRAASIKTDISRVVVGSAPARMNSIDTKVCTQLTAFGSKFVQNRYQISSYLCISNTENGNYFHMRFAANEINWRMAA